MAFFAFNTKKLRAQQLQFQQKSCKLNLLQKDLERTMQKILRNLQVYTNFTSRQSIRQHQFFYVAAEKILKEKKIPLESIGALVFVAQTARQPLVFSKIVQDYQYSSNHCNTTEGQVRNKTNKFLLLRIWCWPIMGYTGIQV